MIEQGPSSEAEMLLAFLRAEIDSPRFSGHIVCCFEGTGLLPKDLITNGDAENEYQNDLRRLILRHYRGYGRNAHLFRSFPADVAWRRVLIEPQDHCRLLFAKEPSWISFSDGTRRVTRLAEKIVLGEVPPNPADHITAIQRGLRNGNTYPELIAVKADDDESLVLVEGHSRASAYVGLKWDKNVEMILGTSPTIRSWVYY